MPKAIQIVSGPLPVAPSDGLRGGRGLGVIENPSDPLDPNGDWVRGYTFDFGPCNAGFTADPCDSTSAKIPVDGVQGRRCVEPFLVIVGRSCSTYGWQASDYAADARRLLEAFEYEIIARELWTGSQAIASGWVDPECPAPGNPFLGWHLDPEWTDLIAANGGVDGDTMTPVEALAALEDGLAACTTTAGLIHMTKRMAVILAAHGLIVREGGRLFTVTGTQVIADRAYDGSGPTTGADPGSIVPGAPATGDAEWMYASGPVTVRIEPGAPVLTPPADEFAAAVNRSTNTIAYFAERRASFSWGCCHLGVNVNPLAPRC